MARYISNKLIFPLVAMFLSVGCKSTLGEPNLTDESLEPLYSMELDVNSVSFAVKSYGCTKAGDFIVVFDRLDQVMGLSILRTKKDRCRRMPQVIKLTLPLDGMELKPNQSVKLVNPMLTKP